MSLFSTPRTVILAAILGFATCLHAATYHLDPVNGSDRGSGAADAPWRTLEAVLASKRTWNAGDVLLLHAGDHGNPVLRAEISGGDVTIRAAEGQKAQLGSLTIRAAAHWIISGLVISPEGVAPGKRPVQTLVTIDGQSHDIVIRGCELYSARDSSGWKESDWLAKSISGISSGAAHSTIEDNRLHNVRFGISLARTAHDSVVARNVIEDFMSDGFRGLADDCVFEGNTAMNCYAIDNNHDDGFQSWSVDENGKVGRGVVRHVTVRGNTFISYTNPAQPYKAAMQGIGCFDGMFEDWVIENNVVVTDMWHGIALLGARNCRIENNTVAKNPINAAARTPWIVIGPHKHGTASTGNVVRNNITPTLDIPASIAALDHNLVTSDYAAVFVDYTHFDLHLRPGSPAINAGSAVDAPTVDRDGKPRVPPIDIGAYEAR